MFCTKCGKEIGDDFNVCPYCGTATPTSTASTSNGTQDNQIYHPRPTANTAQPNNNGYGNLKPDNKYNLVAGLFPFLWSLVKGMWDLTAVCLVFTIIGLIPVIGQVISLVWFFVSLILIGRNANYYYRLKKTQNIWMHQAIKDPQLRRL